MKIATWNVNSLSVRLPQVLDWLTANKPDLLCLQELKLEEAAFPLMDIAAAGYRAAVCGQKTYNGVAVLSRDEPKSVARGIPGFEDDQQRVISAQFDAGGLPLQVVCAYVPNGQSVGSDKYQYKLRFLAALVEWLRGELLRHPRVVLLGDFNIAPEDRDVHDPVYWKDQIMCSKPERAAFHELIALGFVDGFRCFEQPAKSYTWWDYRRFAYRRDRGLRIDHILLSGQLADSCSACVIDRKAHDNDRPSDHVPVVAELVCART